MYLNSSGAVSAAEGVQCPLHHGDPYVAENIDAEAPDFVSVDVVLQADQPHVLLLVPDVGGAVLHHNRLDVDAVLKQKLQVSMYCFLIRPDAHFPRFYLAY